MNIKRIQKPVVFLLLSIGARLFAQQPPPNPGSPPNPVSTTPRQMLRPPPMPGIHPGLRNKAVAMRLLARVLSGDDEELWTTSRDKVTIPGRQVGIKLVGDNITVVVQFTPYLRGAAWVLVAQGQIWLSDEEQRILYETTLQTIPITFGEPVYYFPLGAHRPGGGDYIEIRIELSPLTGEPLERGEQEEVQ